MTTLSEEEKQRIIEEERVRAEARQQFSQTPGASPKRTISRHQWLMILKVILFFVALYFVISYWYLAVPALIIGVLWFWKRIKLSKQHKLYASAALIVLAAATTGWQTYAHRVPTIQVLEPVDAQSLQAATVLVKGKVSPRTALVTVNGSTASVAADGTFEATAKLSEGSNTVTVKAANGEKEHTTSLTINRIFTEEEKAERERLAREREEERARQKAKQDAVKPLLEYANKANVLNDSLTKASSTLGEIFTNKPIPALWSDREFIVVAGFAVVIEEVYGAAREMTPPEEFKQFHSIWLQALKKYADAMPLMVKFVDERDEKALERSTQLILEGRALYEKSNLELGRLRKELDLGF